MGDGEELLEPPPLPDDAVVLRRIPDNSTTPYLNSVRPNSDNFKDEHDGECSVDLYVDEQQPERTLDGHDGYGLIALTVAEIRSVGLDVKVDRIDGNPAHALIIGDKTQPRRRRLSKIASHRWIKLPASVGGKASG